MFFIPPLTEMFYFSGCAPRILLKIPNPNIQIPNNIEVPIQQIRNVRILRIGILNLLVIWYFRIWCLKQNARYERFALVGFPIRKSSDRRSLHTSPKHIAATPRPSSPFLVKASTIRPYANHPNTDFLHLAIENKMLRLAQP